MFDYVIGQSITARWPLLCVLLDDNAAKISGRASESDDTGAAGVRLPYDPIGADGQSDAARHNGRKQCAPDE